jgi:hypothetical protein
MRKLLPTNKSSASTPRRWSPDQWSAIAAGVARQHESLRLRAPESPRVKVSLAKVRSEGER